MLPYYIQTALFSLKRHPVLSLFMILAVTVGVSAPLSAVALMDRLGSDPLPGRSEHIYHVQMDPRPGNVVRRDPTLPDELTWLDANALQHIPGTATHAMMSANRLPIRRVTGNEPLRMTTTRATTQGFFTMFGLKFLAGSGWTAADDASHAQLAVLSRRASERLFGRVDSVGQELIVATRYFRVVGIVDDWNPKPHFYDLDSGAFASSEEIFIPFDTWLDLPQDYGYGPARCWAGSASARSNPKGDTCTWVQYWVELPDASTVNAYRATLLSYAEDQRAQGRFQVEAKPILRSVVDWVNYKQVVPPIVRMQAVIGVGIFLVCMVSAIGLLVAKFSRYAAELALRRALGATRVAVFTQCLVEAGVIGFIGGVLAVPLTYSGFRLIQSQAQSLSDGIQILPASLLQSIMVAIIAMLSVGIYPALLSARTPPARQMRAL